MIFYLEDTWTTDGDADDIMEYVEQNEEKIQLIILTVEQLMEMDSQIFINGTYFCNTDIVQHHLKKLDISHSTVPDTYDMVYSELYLREIEKMKFTDFIEKYEGISRFIKPFLNNKDFDGRVISSVYDFNDYCIPIPKLDQYVYSCEPVVFISEVRLLIGNNQLYGHGHMCKNKNDTYLNDTRLITSLIELTGHQYRCIDIGLKYDHKTKSSRWCIVEINPPFSLDDYTIPFADYIRFCIDACKSINVENMKNS
jgi:hypothetical protein